MIARRTALAGITSTLLFAPRALAAATGSAPHLQTIPPIPRLNEGTIAGLVAPAGFVPDQGQLDLIIAAIEAMGLRPRLAPNLLSRHGYLAGTDQVRANALNAMFADPEISIIFAVRGGWGSARILPLLDYELIRHNPKLLVGFSDITALHLAFAAKNMPFPTIHGPNASASWPTDAWNSLRAIIFDGETPTYSPPLPQIGRLVDRRWPTHTFSPGKAQGRLLGGNLTVLSSLIGTPYLPDFSGAILFLEEVNESEYRIDRMLTQLHLSGILGQVAGVIFGQCTSCQNPGPSYGGFTLYEVLEHHLGGLGVPSFQGALIGHIGEQISIPIGIHAEMDANAATLTILEPVVT